jgi:hypothetical protein
MGDPTSAPQIDPRKVENRQRTDELDYRDSYDRRGRSITSKPLRWGHVPVHSIRYH